MNFFDLLISWLQSLFGYGSHSSSSSSSEDSGSGSRSGGSYSDSSTSSSRSGGGRALITRPEKIGARFNDTGSPAWANQPGGKHWGTDFLAAAGSPVYAPYAMRVLAVGYYPDAGRKGYFVIGRLSDGVEYYSGHLVANETVANTDVSAGQQIGHTNEYAHTHIQMKRKGILIDPEEYLASH